MYVVITAANDDPNYQGSTNPIKTHLKQYKLSDITQLPELNLTADSSKRFQNFDEEIRQIPEFKLKPLVPIYSTIYYYESEYDEWPTVLNTFKQRKGEFWIAIKATSLEPNWHGTTPKIKIILN